MANASETGHSVRDLTVVLAAVLLRLTAGFLAADGVFGETLVVCNKKPPVLVDTILCLSIKEFSVVGLDVAGPAVLVESVFTCDVEGPQVLVDVTLSLDFEGPTVLVEVVLGFCVLPQFSSSCDSLVALDGYEPA